MTLADLTWGVHPNDPRWRHATGTLPNGLRYSVVDDPVYAFEEGRTFNVMVSGDHEAELGVDSLSFCTAAEVDALLKRAGELSV